MFQIIIIELTYPLISVNERDIATVVGALFNPIGIAIGTLVSSSFVTSTANGETTGMTSWLLCQAIITTVAGFLAFIFFQDKPKTPPSASQESTVYAQESSKSFKVALSTSYNQVIECFQERDFLWLFCSFAIGLGIFNAVSTLIEQLTIPACATSNDASTFGGLLIGLGLVGAVIAGIILDRTHRYRLALRIGFSMSFLFTLAMTLLIQPGMINALSAMFAFLGFFMLPMLPVSFSAAAEITYPVPESVSSGVLMTSGQLTGIAFIFALDALIPSGPCNPTGSFTYPGSSVLLVVCIGFSASFIMLFKGSTKRLDVDQGQDSLITIQSLEPGTLKKSELDNPTMNL